MKPCDAKTLEQICELKSDGFSTIGTIVLLEEDSVVLWWRHDSNVTISIDPDDFKQICRWYLGI